MAHHSLLLAQSWAPIISVMSVYRLFSSEVKWTANEVHQYEATAESLRERSPRGPTWVLAIAAGGVLNSSAGALASVDR